MTNGFTEQAGVHIMVKEAVVGHQVFPKCADQLLFEKLAQEDQGIWHMNKCQSPLLDLELFKWSLKKIGLGRNNLKSTQESGKE